VSGQDTTLAPPAGEPARTGQAVKKRKRKRPAGVPTKIIGRAPVPACPTPDPWGEGLFELAQSS